MSKIVFPRTGLIISLFLLATFPAITEGVTTLLSEGFETPFTVAPSGWTVAYTTWLFDWVQYAGDYDSMNPAGPHSGSYNAMLFFGNRFEDHQTWLITPSIDFSSVDPNSDINNITATLEFYQLQRQGIAGGQDTLKIYYNKKGASATTGWTQLASYTSEVETWTKRKITLSHLSSTYAIGFLGNAKYGFGACIDDVRVYVNDSGSTPETKYYAVLCGVSTYQNGDNLNYCHKDVMDVCDALLAMGNWRSENITMLTNEDATKSAIQSAISDMAGKVVDSDLCLFYFSGHGSNDGINTYLVPYDATDTFDNDIRDDQLGTWIGALPTDQYIVMLDSCFSGGFIKDFRTAAKTVKGKGLVRNGSGITPQNGGFTAGFLNGYSSTRAKAQSAITSGVQSRDLATNGRGVVVTASDASEESYETSVLQNGVFTYYLLRGMDGAADTDGDKSISAEESYTYIRPRAAKYTSDPNFIDGPQHAQIYDAWPGELEMGISDPIITRCTVTAKKRPVVTIPGDAITVKGQLGAMASDFQMDSDIAITIDSNDMIDPCVLTFPVDANTFRNDNYSYSKTVDGIKKSFKYNSRNRIFSFSAGKVNLTGLDCPFTLSINIGGYSATIQADEAKVNGKKPIPINLLMGVRDSIRVDKISVKQNTKKLDSDSLTVKGGFSAWDADVNMVEVDVNVIIGEQTLKLQQDSFKAKKTKFTCSKTPVTPSGTAGASFDFAKGAFTLTIKNTNIDDGISNPVNFGINFGDVNLITDVNLP
jgi:hypothetical protein